MFCIKCGTNFGEGKFCPNCGTPASENMPQQTNEPNKALGYQYGQQVSTATPAQPAFSTQPVQKPKRKKGCLIAVIIVVALLCLFIILAVAAVNSVSSSMAEGATASEVSEGVPPEVSLLAQGLDVSEQDAQRIYETLVLCDVGEILEAVRDNGLDNTAYEGQKGYRLNTKKSNNLILYLSAENEVDTLNWADNTLFEEGTVIAKLSDYIITSDEQIEMLVVCKELVKSVLKSPTTAKFPSLHDGWAMSKTPEEIIIQGYVDSQNSFGAMIRSSFQFILSPDKTVIRSFIFDGQELMNPNS